MEYNGYEIKLEIKNNYESAIDTIKKKLYFQDKDLENVFVFYIDEDDCENDLDEDSFDEAYVFLNWRIRRKDEYKEEDEIIDKKEKEDKGISEKKLEEEKKKLTEKLQNEVNEEIKQKIEDLKNKFKKIANERITANNLKYEKKIKELNDIIKQLIEKNKKIIEYAEQKLNDQMEFLNTDFYNNIDSKLKDSNIHINTKNRTIEKEIQSLEKNQNEMSEVMNNCKNNFREIYQVHKKK